MKKTAAFLVSILLLGGCLGGYSPENRFYYLQPAEASAVRVVSQRKLSIGVNSVVLPDYLDKPQIIVFESGSPQMKIAENDRWGEAPASMIQRTIAADIAAYLPRSTVKSRISLTENFDCLVDVQIVRMDMIEGQKAVLEAWWYINDAAGKTVKQGKTVLQQGIDSGFDGYVEAESRMLEQMSGDIARAAAGLK